MALLAPGEPLYLERLMDSARAVEEGLMKSYAKGRRAFRTNHFGAGQIDTGPSAQDSVHHSILLAPALSVAYYNGNRRATRAVSEWMDGWLDAYPPAPPPDRGRRPLFANARRPDGSVTGHDWLPRAWGYISMFPALYSLTGEARYRDVARYWTGTYSSGFLEGAAEIQYALELLPRDRYRDQLLRWSRAAPLELLSDDALGETARRRLLETEITGEVGPAIQALQAGVRNLRALQPAYTWAEPANDRIWLPSQPLAVMSQGGLSHQRNQLWPQHYVSYEGFSDLTAWVSEKSERKLRIWLYSFAPHAESGRMRLWRAQSGRYQLRIGPDSDRDGAPEGAERSELRLRRFSSVPLRLEPGRLFALDLELQGEPEPRQSLPDLALSLERGTGSRALEVSVHNLGDATARDVVVRLEAEGRSIAERRIAQIEAPADLRPRRKTVSFASIGAGTALELRVDPEGAIAEIDEENNAIEIAP
jgi:hypothetical protein